MKTLMSSLDKKRDEDWKLMKLLHLIIAEEAEVHPKRGTYTFMVSFFKFFLHFFLFMRFCPETVLMVSRVYLNVHPHTNS